MTLDRRVSVVIPAFNVEMFVAQAIETALSQTLPPSQVVVVDDGSTDGTADVVARFGTAVELVSRPNGGIGAARNSGIARATGAYLAFLDADDLWAPAKLERQVAALEETDGDIAFCHTVNFRGLPGHQDGPVMIGHAPSATVVTSVAFDRVGPFDESLKLAEFLDWLARAREARLREVTVDEVLFHRRVHDDNIGLREANNRVDYTRVLRAALRRRRAMGEER